MKTVIVTGGIGSGKSAVCALLRERGIPVYDSDSRTKTLYNRRPALLDSLEQALGTDLRGRDGLLDRAKLAGLLFADPSVRETVEGIVYPYVLKDFRRWRSRQGQVPFVVLESAVILSKPLFDGIAQAVVLVQAPESLRLERVMARDGVSAQAARARMEAQEPIPPEKAQIVLENCGSEEELQAAVQRVFFDKNAYICKILNPE